MHNRITVIGLTDSPVPELSADALAAIAGAHTFAGGTRHHAIVHGLLPAESCWIDVTVPLAPVIARIASEPECVVFASGDPLFYGFAATLSRELPETEISVIAAPYSLQMLARGFALAYGPMRCVSLTGRPWAEFDRALIERTPLIGLLTDRSHTPSAIARRMLDYGYSAYTAYVGSRLGNPGQERMARVTLDELAAQKWDAPNCLILDARPEELSPRRLGIPEHEFEGLPGRPRMITKMPVRLLSLALLGLGSRRRLWDVGFCTGSVSVEARLQFPSVGVTAFERRPECAAILEHNARRFGAPGIEAVTADFFELDLMAFPRPDAVFIGGHGGRLAEMLHRLSRVMLPGAAVVFNSVSPATADEFEHTAHAAGLTITARHDVTLDDNNPLRILAATFTPQS